MSAAKSQLGREGRVSAVGLMLFVVLVVPLVMHSQQTSVYAVALDQTGAASQTPADNVSDQVSVPPLSQEGNRIVSPEDLTGLIPGVDYVPGEVLVKFKAEKGLTAAEKKQFHDEVEAEVLSEIKGADVQRVRSKRGESTAELLGRYSKNPFLEYVEPNFLGHVAVIPNDPFFDDLYGLHNTGQTGGRADADIDAPEAWNVQTGSTGVVVADIDTGVDYNHQDLAANMWTNPGEIQENGIDDDSNGFVDDYLGWDFFNNDNNPFDDFDHGTHTSGTVAAVGNNGIGVAGVSWRARIMPLKWISASDQGTAEGAAAAIRYAADKGAKVSNNSWRLGGFSQTVDDAIGYAGSKGMLFVVAAGNTGGGPTYPCTSTKSNVLCVAATDDNDELASFSSYDAFAVDLGAPGVDIYSTVPNNGYVSMKGSSGNSVGHGIEVEASTVKVNGGLEVLRVAKAIRPFLDGLDF